MALATCPMCGSVTIGDRQTCLRCKTEARSEFGYNGVSEQTTDMNTLEASRASVESTQVLAAQTGESGSPKKMAPKVDSVSTNAERNGHATLADGARPAVESGASATSSGELPPAGPTPSPRDGQRGGPGRALLAMGVLIVLLVSVALLSGPSRPTGHPPTPARAAATQTPAPTATVTGTPLPTAQPGYAVFVDPTNGFLIQYPSTWQAQHNDAGVAISDDSASEGYVLQVYREDPATCPSDDTKTASACWVDFFLSHFPSLEAVQNVQRLTGPTPAVTFGGETWQTGVATFVLADSPDRIQVFATVHEDHPYLIAILAPDSLFATGSNAYFKPMLATFQLRLPAAP